MIVGQDAPSPPFAPRMGDAALHHAWLLAGPKGVGKARFADKAALRVLADAAGPPVDAPGLEMPDDHPTARLVAAGSHPDMPARAAGEGKGAELARSINVDQVRELAVLRRRPRCRRGARW